MTKCPLCAQTFIVGDYTGLADHFYGKAERSDVGHVMWLNRNITKTKTDPKTLAGLLANFFDLGNVGLQYWIRRRFIDKFYGARPHPFVLALQHPSRATLLGYVVEHQHFLRQWVRSCAYIVARTDKTDVVLYELDNINTEFGGYMGRPSHYELLLRMGGSLGLDRKKMLDFKPLPDTASGIQTWNQIASEDHWTEAMAAMHGLELIADRSLKDHGASIGYFDPSILKSGDITESAKDFLREGYEADVGHSGVALDLVAKYARELGTIENVQATFLRSIDAFDRYLMARLERATDFEGS